MRLRLIGEGEDGEVVWFRSRPGSGPCRSRTIVWVAKTLRPRPDGGDELLWRRCEGRSGGPPPQLLCMRDLMPRLASRCCAPAWRSPCRRRRRSSHRRGHPPGMVSLTLPASAECAGSAGARSSRHASCSRSGCPLPLRARSAHRAGDGAPLPAEPGRCAAATARRHHRASRRIRPRHRAGGGELLEQPLRQAAAERRWRKRHKVCGRRSLGQRQPTKRETTAGRSTPPPALRPTPHHCCTSRHFSINSGHKRTTRFPLQRAQNLSSAPRQAPIPTAPASRCAPPSQKQSIHKASCAAIRPSQARGPSESKPSLLQRSPSRGGSALALPPSSCIEPQNSRYRAREVGAGRTTRQRVRSGRKQP